MNKCREKGYERHTFSFKAQEKWTRRLPPLVLLPAALENKQDRPAGQDIVSDNLNPFLSLRQSSTSIAGQSAAKERNFDLCSPLPSSCQLGSRPAVTRREDVLLHLTAQEGGREVAGREPLSCTSTAFSTSSSLRRLSSIPTHIHFLTHKQLGTPSNKSPTRALMPE